jgi:hypothetical protein
VNDENVNPFATEEHDDNKKISPRQYVHLQNFYLLEENKENRVNSNK